MTGDALPVTHEHMNDSSRPQPITKFHAGTARVEVFSTRDDAGHAAAIDVADDLSQRRNSRVVFAAAPSQNEFLAHLGDDRAIDWSRIDAFHMDEYLGIAPDHPASFRRYLHEHIIDRVPLRDHQIHLISGEITDRAFRVCLDYEDALRASPIDIVCGGVGENGHLAFNDPPVADFVDPLWIKVVKLDHACREQQVHDGCFATIDDVPTHAYTLTIPALISAATMSIVVPGPLKASAVRAMIEGPIAEACPASILRRHPGARIYLDRDSAALLTN